MERRWPTYGNGIPPASDSWFGVRKPQADPTVSPAGKRGPLSKPDGKKNRCPTCRSLVYGPCRACATIAAKSPMVAEQSEDDYTVEWIPHVVDICCRAWNVRNVGFHGKGGWYPPWTASTRSQRCCYPDVPVEAPEIPLTAFLTGGLNAQGQGVKRQTGGLSAVVRIADIV